MFRAIETMEAIAMANHIEGHRKRQLYKLGTAAVNGVPEDIVFEPPKNVPSTGGIRKIGHFILLYLFPRKKE